MYEPKPPARPWGTRGEQRRFAEASAPLSSDMRAEEAMTPAVIRPAAWAIDAASSRGMRPRHREAIDGGERADHRGVDGRAAEHVGHGHRIEADANDFQRGIAPDDLLGAGIAKLHAERRDAVALVGGIESGIEGDQRQPFAIEQLQE